MLQLRIGAESSDAIVTDWSRSRNRGFMKRSRIMSHVCNCDRSEWYVFDMGELLCMPARRVCDRGIGTSGVG